MLFYAGCFSILDLQGLNWFHHSMEEIKYYAQWNCSSQLL